MQKTNQQKLYKEIPTRVQDIWKLIILTEDL